MRTTPYAIVLLLIEQNGSYILQKRTGSFAAGKLGLPGGKIAPQEAARAAAVREAAEELGIVVQPSDLKFVQLVHRNGSESEFFIVCFRVRAWQGEIVNNEPERCEELVLLTPSAIERSTEIIPAHKTILMNLAQGISYTEHGW